MNHFPQVITMATSLKNPAFFRKSSQTWGSGANPLRGPPVEIHKSSAILIPQWIALFITFRLILDFSYLDMKQCLCAPTPHCFWPVTRTLVSVLSFLTGLALSQSRVCVCVCLSLFVWEGDGWRWEMMLRLQAISRAPVPPLHLGTLYYKSHSPSVLGFVMVMVQEWGCPDWPSSLRGPSTPHALTLKSHDRYMAWTKWRARLKLFTSSSWGCNTYHPSISTFPISLK